jgi:hypothetical protein
MSITPNLTDLQLPREYREPRSRVFPSESSVTWYMRTHRARLVSAGALLKIGNRTYIHPERFDRVVLEVGTAQMERAA